MIENIKKNKLFTGFIVVYALGLFVAVNYAVASITHDIDIGKTNHGLVMYIACENRLQDEMKANERHNYCWNTAEEATGLELKEFNK